MPRLADGIDGLNAAAVRSWLSSAWLFARASLVSLAALALAAVWALLVFRYRVNLAWVIVGAAVAGARFSIFH
jgi:chromate transporter